MTLEKTMQTYAALTAALTAAVVAAAKAGMSQADIQSALEVVTGLVEQSEDE